MVDNSVTKTWSILGPLILNQDFSAAEINVLRQVLQGKTNTQIALALHISVATVKTHLNNMFGKATDIADRTQLVIVILIHRCWYVGSDRTQQAWLRDIGTSPPVLLADLFQTLERLSTIVDQANSYGSVARDMREVMMCSAKAAYSVADLYTLTLRPKSDVLSGELAKEVGAARAWLDALL